MGNEEFIKEQSSKSGKEVPRKSEAPDDVRATPASQVGMGSMKKDMRDVTDKLAQNFNT